MNEILSPKQRQVAFLLASGQSARQVAQEVNIAYQTISKWKRGLAFRQLLDEILSEMETESSVVLKGLRNRAVERLGSLIDSSKEDVALKACDTILSRVGTPLYKSVAEEEHDETLQQMMLRMQIADKQALSGH